MTLENRGVFRDILKIILYEIGRSEFLEKMEGIIEAEYNGNSYSKVEINSNNKTYIEKYEPDDNGEYYYEKSKDRYKKKTKSIDPSTLTKWLHSKFPTKPQGKYLPFIIDTFHELIISYGKKGKVYQRIDEYMLESLYFTQEFKYSLQNIDISDNKDFKEYLDKVLKNAYNPPNLGSTQTTHSFHTINKTDNISFVPDEIVKTNSEEKEYELRTKLLNVSKDLFTRMKGLGERFYPLDISDINPDIVYEAEDTWPETYIESNGNNELKNVLKDIKEEHEPASAVSKNLTLLPIKPQDLIGRKDSIEDIDKLGDKVLLINGLGGIGKTELCRTYFWEKYYEYDYVGWINYESGIKESILRQIKIDIKFDETENMDERYERILHHLFNLKSCLLIIDNINISNDKNLNDISRFPFRVIANSRMKCGNFTLYNLGFMDEDSCKELFYKYYKNVSDEDIFYVEKIIKISGYHTLTIELLAKQCKCSALSVKELYELLEAKGLSLEGIKEKVAATVKNEVENKRLIEHLQKLFQLFNLDDEVERYILSNLSILPSLFIAKKNIKEWLALESLDELNSLINKGWIIEEDDLIMLHKVISEVIRNSNIGPDFEKCKALLKHFGELKYDYNKGNPFNKNNYILFGESILKYIKEDTPEIAALASNIAQIYEEQGDYIYAESLYKRALDIRKQVLGDMHLDTAISLNNLAVLYKRLGKYNKAESLLKKALDIRKQILGEKHPDIATSLHDLAVLYRSLGKYGKAESLYRQALDIRKEMLGDMHPDTAKFINSLAVLYKSQGKYDRAEKLHKRALEISEQVLGDKHPTTAIYLNSLGLLYYNQGKYDEAESLYRRALDIREQALGKKHPDTATSLHNLAGLYESKGEIDKAESLFKRVLDIRRQVLGNKHPSIATTLNNLATLYTKQGKYDEAESTFEKALEISEQLLSGKHPITVLSLNNLAVFYGSQGKYDKAEPLFRKAVIISEQVLGNKHPSTAISLNNLAELYESQGKYDMAESLYKKALKMREQVLGYKHTGITIFLLNLAELYRSQGKYDEAEPLYKRVFEIRSQRGLKDYLQKEAETTLEEKLLKIWKEVFKLKSIGIEDNFYEIGGDSISIIALKLRIQKELGVSIEVSDLYRLCTIREMAAFMGDPNKSS